MDVMTRGFVWGALIGALVLTAPASGAPPGLDGLIQDSGILNGPIVLTEAVKETGETRVVTLTAPAELMDMLEGAPGTESLPHVLVVLTTYDGYEAYSTSVFEKLVETGQFGSVTWVNGNAMTPSAGTMQAYDAVFVFSDYESFPGDFQDRNALGNSLADAVDAGTGVVLGMFANAYEGQNYDCHIGGRFESDGYFVFQSQTDASGGAFGLGTHIATHPIMAGVTDFQGGDYSIRPSKSSLSYYTGSSSPEVVASWDDAGYDTATPLVAVVDGMGPANARRVDLGFFPIADDAPTQGDGYLWDPATDGALLMANALSWAARSTGDRLVASQRTLGFGLVGLGMPAEMSFDVINIHDATAVNITGMQIEPGDVGFALTGPFTGSLAAGASETITVQLDPVGTGLHEAVLTISSDDPGNAELEVELRGRGVLAPNASVAMDPDPLEFPSVPQGGKASGTITISNTGAGELSYSIAGAMRPQPTAATKVAIEAAGGPDSDGYRWIDSNQPGGPTVAWIDISGTGTAAVSAGHITLPFPFPFYGAPVTAIDIDEGGSVYLYSEPDGSYLGELRVLDDSDYGLTIGGGSITYQGDASRAIIQYTGVTEYSEDMYSRLTFQAILFPGGDILYQYLSMDSGSYEPYYYVSISADVATDGTLYACDYASDYVQSNMAILFSPTPFWLSVDPISGTVPPGAPGTPSTVDVDVTVDAADLGVGGHSRTLVVVNNDLDEGEMPVGVPITVVGSPVISPSVASVAFGETTPDAYPPSSPETVDIDVTNTGAVDLDPPDITLGGDDPTAFTVTWPGHPSPSPGVLSTATVSPFCTVDYTPDAAGEHNAVLTISNAGQSVSKSIPLHGIARNAPVMSVTTDPVGPIAMSVNAGNIVNSAVTVTVTNDDSGAPGGSHDLLVDMYDSDTNPVVKPAVPRASRPAAMWAQHERDALAKVAAEMWAQPFGDPLERITCMARAPNGDLFVGVMAVPEGRGPVGEWWDYGQGEIWRVEPGGTALPFFSAADEYAGNFTPVDLAFDSAGRLHVSDYYNGRVLRFSPDGDVEVLVSMSESPMGLAFGPPGVLYVTAMDLAAR